MEVIFKYVGLRTETANGYTLEYAYNKDGTVRAMQNLIPYVLLNLRDIGYKILGER